MFRQRAQEHVRRQVTSAARARQLAASPFAVGDGLVSQQAYGYRSYSRRESTGQETGFGGIKFAMAGAVTMAMAYGLTQSKAQADLAHAEAAPEEGTSQSSDKTPHYESHKEATSQGSAPQGEAKEGKQSFKVHPNPLEIPRMLQQREAQKKREYAERAKMDVRNILDKEEAEEMRLAESDQDALFNADPQRGDLLTADQTVDGDEEFTEAYSDLDDSEDPTGKETLTELIKDPLANKKQMMTPQEYRVVTIGDEGLVKEGQMIQVAISDPFDEDKFYPTDKIIVLKHKDQLYALGSYCGFDFTNLATGALLGEKLICPTCLSSYDIKNGLVDIGPSMRNLSSFAIKTREGKIKVTVPEHIPAFARRRFLGRSKIDPRTYVVIGDSAAALSAMDALRMGFTGNIINVPVSQYGQFENTDILNKKFSPLTKNETYLTDNDFLDRANITVMKSGVKSIDKQKRELTLKGQSGKIKFEKLLWACGAHKKRLRKEYTNCFYLEDRFSHAKCHNELIKAKKVVVMGSTMEAYQTASSVRAYLDSIYYTDVEVILLSPRAPDIARNMGVKVNSAVRDLMREQGVQVIDDCQVFRMDGEYRLDKIHFRKRNDKENAAQFAFSKTGMTEYFIKPDMVIVEDGLGDPKLNLQEIVGPEEGSNLTNLMFSREGIPTANMRFSLHPNDLSGPILAAGSGNDYPSFFHKFRVRTQDIKYNVEAGFYAAMNMMDKQVEFRYIPMQPLTIGDKKLYFVGEYRQPISEVIFRGRPESGKFVAFFCFGDEVCGFLTCGYQNLHIYLMEAMKQLIMPSAAMLRANDGNFDDLVNMILRMRPDIEAGRQYTVNTPSVIRAEFTREIDTLNNLRQDFRINIRNEEQKAINKMNKIKQKYDRDGVTFIENEAQMGRQQAQQPKDPTNLGPKEFDALPPRGHVSRMREQVNMGGTQQVSTNPISSVIKGANQIFSPASQEPKQP